MGSREVFFPHSILRQRYGYHWEGLVFCLVGKGTCYKIEPLKVILLLFCFILFLRWNLTKRVFFGPGLGMQTRLVLDSQRSVRFCFPRTRIKGTCDHTQQLVTLLLRDLSHLNLKEFSHLFCSSELDIVPRILIDIDYRIDLIHCLYFTVSDLTFWQYQEFNLGHRICQSSIQQFLNYIPSTLSGPCFHFIIYYS